MSEKLITAQPQDSEPGSCALWVSYRQIKCQCKLVTSGLLEIFVSSSQFPNRGANDSFDSLRTPVSFQSSLKARAFLKAQFQNYVVFSYLHHTNAILM